MKYFEDRKRVKEAKGFFEEERDKSTIRKILEKLNFSDEEWERAKKRFSPQVVEIEEARRVSSDRILMQRLTSQNEEIVVHELEERDFFMSLIKEDYLKNNNPDLINLIAINKELSVKTVDVLRINKIILYLETLKKSLSSRKETSFFIDKFERAIDYVLLSKIIFDDDFNNLKEFKESNFLDPVKRSMLLEPLIKIAPSIIDLDDLLLGFKSREDQKKIISSLLKFSEENAYYPLFILQRMKAFGYDSFSNEVIKGLENKTIDQADAIDMECWYYSFYIAKEESELEAFVFEKVKDKRVLKKEESIPGDAILRYFQ